MQLVDARVESEFTRTRDSSAVNANEREPSHLHRFDGLEFVVSVGFQNSSTIERRKFSEFVEECERGET